jgi:hypothetical protein
MFAALVALAACGSSSAEPDKPATSTGAVVGCAPPGARVIASSTVAQAFSLGDNVYGCSDRTGRRSKLGKADFCIGTQRAGPVAVTGDLAAYGLETCGTDTGFTIVVVRRLTDGKQLFSDSATTNPLGPESYETVDSLVLKADAAVAWIADGRSIVQNKKDIEVHEAHKGRQTLLDSGAPVKTRSLQLHGSKLTWRHGKTTRSAVLN